MKDIYKLKMHEVATVEDKSIEVIRVPGGWLYSRIFSSTVSNNIIACNTVFVSHDSEFNDKYFDINKE